MVTKIETLKKPNGDQVLPRTRAKAVSMENGITVEAAIESLNNTVNSIAVPTKLSELAEDATHRLVTDIEKTVWNAKSDFSGSYNDLTDKPDIPLIEDLATKEYVNQLIIGAIGGSY